MKKSELDFLAILNRLAGHEVDFIVVGGVGAILQGAPIATSAMEVVHSREPHNVNKLLISIDSLDARYREAAGRNIKPTRSYLSSPGHQLLMTRFGPLDLLGVIGSKRDYQSLLPESDAVEISEDLKVRVLCLSTIIKSKEEAGGEKDRAVLPTLRRALEEKSNC